MKLNQSRTKWLLIVVLLITAIVYCFSVFENGFTTWDDNRYITENEILQNGSLGELIFQPFDGHFHPVTMISLKVDYIIGGLNPFMFQATNVFLHLLNTLLVFQLLKSLFRDDKMALVIAAFFGLAAVNVESVVWMSERKNVLSTFFYLLTAIYYLRSFESKNSFWLSLLFFSLGIFSKVTVISIVPCFFLFDYVVHKKKTFYFLKKLPFVIIAIVFGLVAISAQSELRVESLSSSYNLLDKIAMSSYAFTMYLIKPFYPFELSAIYPYPINESAISLYGLYILAPIITFFALTFFVIKKQTILLFGLLFFVFNILLLLKFFDFPLGDYILADRYDYIPMIGLGVFAFELFRLFFKSKSIAAVCVSAFVLLNIPFTFFQIKTWKSDVALFDRVLENYPNSDIALNNRGMIYMEQKENKQAMECFKKAYKNNHGNYEANLNLANLLTLEGQADSALVVYNTTIENASNVASAYYNRAIYYYMQGDYELAYSDAIRTNEINNNYPHLDLMFEELDPKMFDIAFHKGVEHAKKGELKEAISAFSRAAQFDPNNASNNENLALAKDKYFKELFEAGISLGNDGDFDGAIAMFEEVLRIEPQNKEAQNNIAYANSIRK